MKPNKPLIAIVMGSSNDWQTLNHAANQLDELNIPYAVEIVSAQDAMPDRAGSLSDSKVRYLTE